MTSDIWLALSDHKTDFYKTDTEIEIETETDIDTETDNFWSQVTIINSHFYRHLLGAEQSASRAPSSEFRV